MIEFKHIVSPIDFSECSARALAHAAALARWYDAKLTVLHARRKWSAARHVRC